MKKCSASKSSATLVSMSHVRDQHCLLLSYSRAKNGTMRRIASQAAKHLQKQSAQSLRCDISVHNAASPRQPPLRGSYVALSDFFRSNSQQQRAISSTIGHRRTSAEWSSRSRLVFASDISSQKRAITSTSRRADQLQAKKGADHQQTSTESNDKASSSQPGSTGTTKASASDTASPGPSAPLPDVIEHVSSFPRSLRQLAMSLPTASLRRPTKEE